MRRREGKVQASEFAGSAQRFLSSHGRPRVAAPTVSDIGNAVETGIATIKIAMCENPGDTRGVSAGRRRIVACSTHATLARPPRQLRPQRRASSPASSRRRHASDRRRADELVQAVWRPGDHHSLRNLRSLQVNAVCASGMMAAHSYRCGWRCWVKRQV